MKRILILGAGGTPATNFVRSLRHAPEKFYLIGTDSNKYYIHRSETDDSYLVPSANEKDYIKILNSIIDETGAEFFHCQNDAEMFQVSKNRKMLNAKLFLPEHKTIQICQNKHESYKKWSKAGLKVPETVKINDEKDLKDALKKFKTIWIRDTTGAGGRGSLKSDNFDVAKAWIDFMQGWGKYTASEYLSPDSVTWQSIWNKGELIVAQGRLRLYWELSKISPSGITGATGGAVTHSDPILDDIAQKAIFAIDKRPHGIFSVDLTYDRNRVPNPTEINIGRFFTTHEFFTRAGLNMPYIFVKLAYNEKLPKITNKLNPLKLGLVWIRGIDFLPVLTNIKSIDKKVEELRKRR
ncbi:carboxylate--amine ligase [Candidatus Woesearchaeota archaeon]|nr:carboxylate--amine ligase [Candidatus Woesearchaeota archaeon]